MALALGATAGIGGAVYAKQIKPNQLAAAAIIGGGIGYVVGDRLEDLNPVKNLKDAAGNLSKAVTNTGRSIKNKARGAARGAKNLIGDAAGKGKGALRGAAGKGRSAANTAKSTINKAVSWRPW
jgi:hypothetical protein